MPSHTVSERKKKRAAQRPPVKRPTPKPQLKVPPKKRGRR